MSKRIGSYPRVRVSGGGSGVVSQAGKILLDVALAVALGGDCLADVAGRTLSQRFRNRVLVGRRRGAC